MSKEQKFFPFFVNGQFWQEQEVRRCDYERGFCVWHVTSKLTPEIDVVACKMKQVVFRIAECCQIGEHDIGAQWISGFWLYDESVYLKDGRIYLKGE